MTSSPEELAELAAAFPDLLGPGAPFALRFEEVLGVEIPVWAERHRSMRAALLASMAHGDHPYLITDDLTVTYEEHARAAAALGVALREHHGVRPGDRVAIVAANSPGWIRAFWAAQWIGALPVGCNAWWTTPELAYALDHADPALVVVDDERHTRLPDVDVPVLTIERDLDALTEVVAADDALGLELPVAEDDPAVVLYTSGTTGRPKGVVHTHRNLAAVINFHGFNDALARMFGVPDDPPRRDFTILPLFHIASLHNLAVARLGQGTTLVMYQGRFEPDRVLATLARHRVTNWGAVPTMARRLITHADPSAHDLSALRTFAMASAPSTPALHAQVREHLPIQALSNSYGLTETSTAITVATPVDLASHPTSVGRPVLGVAAEVRGPDGQRLPDGEIGEIWTRSQYTMLGYWRDPEATAETIAPDRWLRTGDLGRFVDGQLFLDTRRSDLIIRGGENVYPAEVEGRLLEHPAVEECLVVGVDDEDLGQAVGAIVVMREPAAVDVDQLAAFAGEGLAYFKVPARWHLTTEPLPRNATGKVVRRELDDVFA